MNHTTHQKYPAVATIQINGKTSTLCYHHAAERVDNALAQGIKLGAYCHAAIAPNDSWCADCVEESRNTKRRA